MKASEEKSRYTRIAQVSHLNVTFKIVKEKSQFSRSIQTIRY
jgi:hypothetical protein